MLHVEKPPLPSLTLLGLAFLIVFWEIYIRLKQLANTSTDINHKYFFVIFDLKSALCIYGKYAEQQKSMKN
jgi:hypothetical protein